MVVRCFAGRRAAVHGAPRAAAQEAALSGNVLDVAGKPWADMTIDAVSDQGVKVTAKTDKDGNYSLSTICARAFIASRSNFPRPTSRTNRASASGEQRRDAEGQREL